MEQRLKASRVEMSVLAHATEDLDKVKHALKEALPLQLREAPTLTVEDLEGYYGNPIELIKVTLHNQDWASAFMEHLRENLSDDDLRSVIYNLDQHLDKEGNLFLRLDKQAALLGKLRLRQDDAIRLKIKLLRGNMDYIRFTENVKSLLGKL